MRDGLRGWIAVAAAAALLLTGCGSQDPADAYTHAVDCAARGDWGAFYDRLTEKTRDQLDAISAIAALVETNRAGVSPVEVAEERTHVERRLAYVDSMKDFKESDRQRIISSLRGTVTSQQVRGDQATLVLTADDGRTQDVRMIQEHGTWKLDQSFDLFESLARRNGTDPESERTAWALRQLLGVLRGSVADYTHWHGAPPDVAGSWEWAPLRGPPLNPRSPAAVASRVAEVTESGAGWDAVPPARAGWIWNSTDHKLYAAGFDDAADRRAEWAARSDESKAHGLRTLLLVARGAISEHRRLHGGDPDILARQWDALKNRPPIANPLSPDGIAKRIVEVTQPGVRGTAVDPAAAGWVWNSTDGQIYLAGYDEAAGAPGSGNGLE